MPSLNELRKNMHSSFRPQYLATTEGETLVSDQRGQLTPRQMVESKLGLALAQTVPWSVAEACTDAPDAQDTWIP